MPAAVRISPLPEADGPVTTLVFKTLSDPFVGKISIMKVITGTIKTGMELVNTRSGKAEKINKLVFLRGRTQIDTQEAHAGDIVAVPKLAYTETGDTLCGQIDSREPMSASILLRRLSLRPSLRRRRARRKRWAPVWQD